MVPNRLNKAWVVNPEDEGVRDLFKLNTELSHGDKELVARVYPKPQIPGVKPTKVKNF